MPMPFRRLPYLVLKDVLKNLNFVELFTMTRVSRRMKNFVKNNVKHRHHQVEIFIDDEISFQFSRSTDDEIDSVICAEGMDQIQSEDVGFTSPIGKWEKVYSLFTVSETDHPMVITYWRDKFTGLFEMYNDLFNLFSVPIKRVQFDLKHIGDFQKCMWILEETKSLNTVQFSMEPKDYQKTELVRLNVGEVFIRYGRWVKLSHLQSMNCKTIKVQYATLTDGNLNSFLLNLQKGSNPNLKEMRICFVRRRMTNLVIDGLNAVEIDQGVFNFQLDGGENCCLKPAWFVSMPSCMEFQLFINRVE